MCDDARFYTKLKRLEIKFAVFMKTNSFFFFLKMCFFLTGSQANSQEELPPRPQEAVSRCAQTSAR